MSWKELKEKKIFTSPFAVFMLSVQKIIAKFPFGDQMIQDLSLLDPRHRFEASTALVTRLCKRFSPAADLDAVLLEFRDYQPLPECQMPTYTSLEEF